MTAATLASLDIKAARVCAHYGVVRTGPPAYDSLDDAGHRVRRHRLVFHAAPVDTPTATQKYQVISEEPLP